MVHQRSAPHLAKGNRLGLQRSLVAGRKLVLHHRLNNEEIVQCFDAATGNPFGDADIRAVSSIPSGYNNGPRCTPTLTTNRCFTFGAEGRLSCLD